MARSVVQETPRTRDREPPRNTWICGGRLSKNSRCEAETVETAAFHFMASNSSTRPCQVLSQQDQFSISAGQKISGGAIPIKFRRISSSSKIFARNAIQF